MNSFDRRSVLRVGSISAFGSLGWGTALQLRAQAAAAQKSKRELSVIHLWLAGGMSQLDTFDMKPNGDAKFRSPFKEIPTSVPGTHICEHLPKLAKITDKLLIIRSMNHKISDHPQAMTFVMTGHQPLPTIQCPSIQAVVSRESATGGELPPAVSIPGPAGNWDRAGFLGSRYNPFAAGDPNQDSYKVRDLELPMGVDWARVDHRRGLLSIIDRKFRAMDKTGIAENMDSYYQTAFDLIRSDKAKKTFKIEEEPEPMRERYGRTSFGQGCLMARRLVESGVRFVTVSRGVGAWDHHQRIFQQLSTDFLPDLDRSFSALIEDLEQRGMLESTLVLVSGEFGRTPEVNGNTGRDHWPNAFTLLMAGGGVPGGRVWGESDKNAAFVKDNPVQVPDLLATVYHKLGIDYQKEYISNTGRPIRIGAGGRPLPFV